KTTVKSAKSSLEKLSSLEGKIKSIQSEQEKIKADLNSFLTTFLTERGAFEIDFTTLLGALDSTLKTLKSDPISHEKFFEIGKKLLKN
ncbi:MAG TPA: hypothetical protein VI959_02870, partial [Alphaproteobacteria bacterium]|nr:hypothetical protein [Alphaproteobacteria bacterium]